MPLGQVLLGKRHSGQDERSSIRDIAPHHLAHLRKRLRHTLPDEESGDLWRIAEF